MTVLFKLTLEKGCDDTQGERSWMESGQNSFPSSSTSRSGSVRGGVLTLQAIQTDWNPEEYFFLLDDRDSFVNINLYDTMSS